MALSNTVQEVAGRNVATAQGLLEAGTDASRSGPGAPGVLYDDSSVSNLQLKRVREVDGERWKQKMTSKTASILGKMLRASRPDSHLIADAYGIWKSFWSSVARNSAMRSDVVSTTKAGTGADITFFDDERDLCAEIDGFLEDAAALRLGSLYGADQKWHTVRHVEHALDLST